MTFDEYQAFVRETSHYPVAGHPVVYPTLALAGEAGEAANEVKKLIRDDKLVLTESRREKLISELGDILWYVTATGQEAEISLMDIAARNMTKLRERRAAQLCS